MLGWCSAQLGTVWGTLLNLAEFHGSKYETDRLLETFQQHSARQIGSAQKAMTVSQGRLQRHSKKMRFQARAFVLLEKNGVYLGNRKA